MLVVYISSPGCYLTVIVIGRKILACEFDLQETCDRTQSVIPLSSPSVAADDTFMLYKGGIFAGCTSKEPNHAITVSS